jgi:hypothetical protein
MTPISIKGFIQAPIQPSTILFHGRNRTFDATFAITGDYPAKLFTNSTRLRSAIPEGPFAIHGF